MSIKNTLLVLVLLLLPACSVANTHYHPPQKPTVQEQNFHSLVMLVRTTVDKPNNLTKLKAREYASNAGLVPNCINKNDCFLLYGNIRVRIDQEWIHIESGTSQLKVQDIEEAIRIIYHHH